MIPQDVAGPAQQPDFFTLAILVGVAVISKVPATLHTPLMSGANSIHGIVLVGAMLIAAEVDDPIGYLLAFVAVAFATMNVVGGYVVTDRMLQMFTKKPVGAQAGRRDGGGLADGHPRIDRDPRPRPLDRGRRRFVLGLLRMNSPATARNGNLLSAGGMAIAIGATAVLSSPGSCSATGSARIGWVDHPGRHRDRRRAGPVHGADREDDRDAAAGVAVQRGRRRRGRADRDRRLPRLARRRAPIRLDTNDLHRPRHHHRLDHVHRLAHRLGQAPGPDPRQADPDPGRPARDRSPWRPSPSSRRSSCSPRARRTSPSCS